MVGLFIMLGVTATLVVILNYFLDIKIAIIIAAIVFFAWYRYNLKASTVGLFHSNLFAYNKAITAGMSKADAIYFMVKTRYPEVSSSELLGVLFKIENILTEITPIIEKRFTEPDKELKMFLCALFCYENKLPFNMFTTQLQNKYISQIEKEYKRTIIRSDDFEPISHDCITEEKDHLYFEPKWLKLISSELRPDKKRVSKIEKLRVKHNISHHMLSQRVMSSPAMTRKVLRKEHEIFKERYFEVPEKELFKKILISKFQDLPGFEISKQELDQVMENIDSLEKLCDYVINRGKKDLKFPFPSDIGEKIDEILLQEECEKKAPAEKIITFMEHAYFKLRKKYPGKDEHWYLANAWLKRYGATKAAKQKGPELIRIIAYKDTHQFATLASPKSIRGLSLFLVYKELGEKFAHYYASEFNCIMEQVLKY